MNLHQSDAWRYCLLDVPHAINLGRCYRHVFAVDFRARQLAAAAFPAAGAVGIDSDRREPIGGVADLDRMVVLLHGCRSHDRSSEDHASRTPRTASLGSRDGTLDP
jgi:hypothetical protein